MHHFSPERGVCLWASQERVKVSADVCGRVHMCVCILILLMCLMYDEDPCHTHTSSYQNPRGKTSMQRELKLFFEDESDIAITTDSERKIRKR